MKFDVLEERIMLDADPIEIPQQWPVIKDAGDALEVVHLCVLNETYNEDGMAFCREVADQIKNLPMLDACRVDVVMICPTKPDTGLPTRFCLRLVVPLTSEDGTEAGADEGWAECYFDNGDQGGGARNFGFLPGPPYHEMVLDTVLEGWYKDFPRVR